MAKLNLAAGCNEYECVSVPYSDKNKSLQVLANIESPKEERHVTKIHLKFGHSIL